MVYHVANVRVSYASGDYQLCRIKSKAIGARRACRSILRKALATHGGCCEVSILSIERTVS